MNTEANVDSDEPADRIANGRADGFSFSCDSHLTTSRTLISRTESKALSYVSPILLLPTDSIATCRNRTYSTVLLAATIGRAGLFVDWLHAAARRAVVRLDASEGRRTMETRLAEYGEAGEGEWRHVKAIAERWTAARCCPRCQQIFTDFVGLSYLSCARPECCASFCAWCLVDCGTEAQAKEHVVQCRHRRNKAGEVSDAHSFSLSVQEWSQVQEERRDGLFAEYLEGEIEDESEREKVREMVKSALGWGEGGSRKRRRDSDGERE